MRSCCKRCNECEMIAETEIVIVEQHGLTESRRFVPALKCRRFGQVSTTYVQLPESKQMDEIIFRRR
jgi:hypothetical protein